MTPEMWNLLLPLVGAVAAAVLHKLGIQNPLKPDAPPATPAVDPQLTDVNAWLLNVKSGKVKPDDLDYAMLAQIKPLVDELLAAKK